MAVRQELPQSCVQINQAGSIFLIDTYPVNFGNVHMRPCVFIQTNHKQILGAIVAEYAVRRNSPNARKFDTRIIHHKDHPFFQAREGQKYLREGHYRLWRNNDLQSFTLTRFMPPELMQYKGRSLEIDPDIFAIGDVWELLDRDMKGKSILARPLRGKKGEAGYMASSVMLMDNEKLKHWNVEKQFNDMFSDQRDYGEWLGLKYEPPNTIGLLEPEWNDLDVLTCNTKMLHTTQRRTQPWKTGLPVDHIPRDDKPGIPLSGPILRLKRKIFGDYAFLGQYRQHPDLRQEQLFFALLAECIDEGLVTGGMVREQMAHNHVRHDAFEVLERTPPLDSVLADIARTPALAA